MIFSAGVFDYDGIDFTEFLRFQCTFVKKRDLFNKPISNIFLVLIKTGNLIFFTVYHLTLILSNAKGDHPSLSRKVYFDVFPA